MSLKKLRGTAETSPRPEPCAFRRPGDRCYLVPEDPDFAKVLETSYRGFALEPHDELPDDLHRRYGRAFDGLDRAGLFLYDVVAAGGKLSRTFVKRTLVGEPGITYKYLGLRIFAHPWRATAAEEGEDADEDGDVPAVMSMVHSGWGLRSWLGSGCDFMANGELRALVCASKRSNECTQCDILNFGGWPRGRMISI